MFQALHVSVAPFDPQLTRVDFEKQALEPHLDSQPGKRLARCVALSADGDGGDHGVVDF